MNTTSGLDEVDEKSTTEIGEGRTETSSEGVELLPYGYVDEEVAGFAEVESEHDVTASTQSKSGLAEHPEEEVAGFGDIVDGIDGKDAAASELSVSRQTESSSIVHAAASFTRYFNATATGAS